MKVAKIAAICVVAAVIYGIIHDEITAHLCVEYFTVAHAHLFDTESPALLGVLWGITGTWWLGLLLGVILGCVATFGGKPVIMRFLLVRIALILGFAALTASVCGIGVYCFASDAYLNLPDPLVPVNKHRIFYAVWAAHLGSYVAVISASLVVILNVWSLRLKRGAPT